MAPGTEGGFTKLFPDDKVMPIYDAVVEYKKRGTDLIVIGGKEYGTGSSRDWAAKGTKLLGIKAVIAESFERIHRSNLIGMGILPLQFMDGVDRKKLKLILIIFLMLLFSYKISYSEEKNLIMIIKKNYLLKKKLSLLKINQLMFYTFFCLPQKNNKLYIEFYRLNSMQKIPLG